MEYIEDVRQPWKVKHSLKDILVIVLFATLANADDWVEIGMFSESYQDYLWKNNAWKLLWRKEAISYHICLE